MSFTRREALAAGAASALLTAPAAAEGQPEGASRWTLWYRQPAEAWVEALPVGTGRLGAMVFGGTARERLQLNEDTLWGGGPYDPSRTEALAALPEVRRLIREEMGRRPGSGPGADDGEADPADVLSDAG